MTRPSKLPKWTEVTQFTDRNMGVHMDKYHTALQIAWDALSVYANTHEGAEARKAMRKIRRLGNE